MIPATLNLTIYQGATFSKQFQWKTGKPLVPVDISDCSLRMQIRRFASDGIKTQVWTPSHDTQLLLELSTENGRIIITDAIHGIFKLNITADETATLSFVSGMYDLEIIFPGGEPVHKLLNGSVQLVPEITR